MFFKHTPPLSTPNTPSRPSEIALGQTCRDNITGFSGVAVGVVTYITGCRQVLLAPKVDSSGAFRSSEWFDEQRLAVSADEPVIQMPTPRNGTIGPDRPAQKI